MRELTLLDDVVNMNHFPGSKKNWDKQLEEDVDRGKKCEDGTDEDDDTTVHCPEDQDGWEFYAVP